MAKEYSEDELYDMSDEEIEALAREEKVSLQNNDFEDTFDNEGEKPSTESTTDDNVNDEVANEENNTEENTDAEVEDNIENENPTNEADGSQNDNLNNDGEGDDSGNANNAPQNQANAAETQKPNQGMQNIKQPEILKYKANGKEFTFTKDEVLADFGKVFGQAMNYTQKMQWMAPHRKNIIAMEEAGVTTDDVNTLIDAIKNKNKQALYSLVKRVGVEPSELVPDEFSEEGNDLEGYVPQHFGPSDEELKINEVVDTIRHDPEFLNTQAVLTKEWDTASRDEFAQDPSLIQDLHEDIKSGLFNIINDNAQKLKVIDGGKKKDIEYYGQSAVQYYQHQDMLRRQQWQNQQHQRQQQPQVQQQVQQQQNVNPQYQQMQQPRNGSQQNRPVASNKTLNQKRRNAGITTSKASNKGAIDYLNASEEEFDAWYKEKMQDY